MYSPAKNIILGISLFLSAVFSQAQEKNDSQKCRYSKTSNGYLMVFRERDDVLTSIEDLAKEQQTT